MNIEEITNYIFLNDNEPDGDIAFVFGTHKALSKSVNQVTKLYKNKLFPKVIFTGGINADSKIIESEEMEKLAIQLGISSHDILIENKSTNTLENVIFSIPIIDREIGLEKIKTITAIVKNYHSRRAVMTLRKHLPAHIQIKASAYDSENDKFSSDAWFKTTQGKEKIFEEIEKIKQYLEKGDLAEI